MSSSSLALGRALVRFTGRAEGDLGHGGPRVRVDEVDPEVAERRAAVCPLPWTWLRQVHGSRLVHVGAPGQFVGQAADAAVTTVAGAALAILTADCAPVALVGDAPSGPVLGVVHAGWRGLLGGVIERTVEAMRCLGGQEIEAAIGPCIHPECYEFGSEDLARVASRLGEGVISVTSWGRPALDVPAGVRSALSGVRVTATYCADICTACSPAHFSHRRGQLRGHPEIERQAMVAWISPND